MSVTRRQCVRNTGDDVPFSDGALVSEIAGLASWPRGTRIHTHAHVLDIAARQRSLNYPPGAEYSYTNTGYNLLVLIAERVSGKSFSELRRQSLSYGSTANPTARWAS